MSLLHALGQTLFSNANFNRARRLIVLTQDGSFEGEYMDHADGALTITLWASSGPTGNTLLIPESEIRMIEIDWLDTYGLVNDDEVARVAAAVRRQAG